MNQTPMHSLADHLLGEDGPLDKFVAERRPETPWRKIARQLEDRTGIDVTYETLRTWFPEESDADRAADFATEATEQAP